MRGSVASVWLDGRNEQPWDRGCLGNRIHGYFASQGLFGLGPQGWKAGRAHGAVPSPPQPTPGCCHVKDEHPVGRQMAVSPL